MTNMVKYKLMTTGRIHNLQRRQQFQTGPQHCTSISSTILNVENKKN